MAQSSHRNTHNKRSLIRASQVCQRRRAAGRKQQVEEYKHTHTHTHTHTPYISVSSSRKLFVPLNGFSGKFVFNFNPLGHTYLNKPAAECYRFV